MSLAKKTLDELKELFDSGIPLKEAPEYSNSSYSTIAKYYSYFKTGDYKYLPPSLRPGYEGRKPTINKGGKSKVKPIFKDSAPRVESWPTCFRLNYIVEQWSEHIIYETKTYIIKHIKDYNFKYVNKKTLEYKYYEFTPQTTFQELLYEMANDFISQHCREQYRITGEFVSD